MDDPVETDPAVPGALRAACAVIGLEALGLVVLAGWVVVDAAAGHAEHTLRGLLGGLFALLGAAALALGARGLLRLSPAARTPIVVLELLALPTGYSIAFTADRPELGGPILIAAVVVIYLLFTPPVREIMDRRPRD